MPQDPLSALTNMLQQQMGQAAQTLNQINMGLTQVLTLPLQMLSAGVLLPLARLVTGSSLTSLPMGARVR